jgi:hypothetical protein
MNMKNIFLVDGVSAVAVHNGVARVQFMKIGVDGKATDSHELLVPLSAVKSVMDALRKLPGA